MGQGDFSPILPWSNIIALHHSDCIPATLLHCRRVLLVLYPVRVDRVDVIYVIPNIVISSPASCLILYQLPAEVPGYNATGVFKRSLPIRDRLRILFSREYLHGLPATPEPRQMATLGLQFLNKGSLSRIRYRR